MATKTKKARKSAVKTTRKITPKKANKKANAKLTIKAKASVKQLPKPRTSVKPALNPQLLAREIIKPAAKPKTKIRPAHVRAVVHTTPISAEGRRALRSLHATQFAYMKAPGAEHAFEVGDTVEVFCDHERSNERVRGWIKGIVVQVDNKMVAVQFRSNVFLTDGWMVPDRILWYPVTSDQIRAATYARKGSRQEIPDY